LFGQPYNLKRLVPFILVVAAILFSQSLDAQSGGRKRERSSKRKSGFTLKRTRSAGNADKFARGGSHRGMFTRLFKKSQPAWVYRPNGTPKKNWRENRFLFSRHRSEGKVANHEYQQKQNDKRARRRTRGNEKFAGRKYKR